MSSDGSEKVGSLIQICYHDSRFVAVRTAGTTFSSSPWRWMTSVVIDRNSLLHVFNRLGHCIFSRLLDDLPGLLLLVQLDT